LTTQAKFFIEAGQEKLIEHRARGIVGTYMNGAEKFLSFLNGLSKRTLKMSDLKKNPKKFAESVSSDAGLDLGELAYSISSEVKDLKVIKEFLFGLSASKQSVLVELLFLPENQKFLNTLKECEDTKVRHEIFTIKHSHMALPEDELPF